VSGDRRPRQAHRYGPRMSGLGLPPALSLAALSALSVLTLLPACGTEGHDVRGALKRAGSTSSSTAASTTTSTVAQLPVTPVAWTPCGGDLQCGSVTVPLDYSDPSGATISIALERHPAEVPSQRIGSLVINPGGPGASGIDDLPSELSILTPELLDDFDVVSFDPRGVERSDPVDCGTSGAPSSNTSPLPDPVPTTSSAQASLLYNDRQYASQCEKNSAALLPHVGTVDTARDLDRIREALGDAELTFIGHSYGTLLGATYAQMFPTHVRAMVLDGAIDPAASAADLVLQQAESFENVLDDFFSWCQGAGQCAWHPTGDATSALLAIISASRANPLPGPNGSTAGPGEIYNALLSGLYARSDWPSLADSIAQAAGGDGSGVIAMSDAYRRNGASNGADAAEAIWCLDHPVSRDAAVYAALAAAHEAQAPVFGPLLAWGLLGCAVWPALPTRTPAPTTAFGSPPILVTGATMDPATPYSWAVNLAHELSRGVLVTWQGENHVAYYYSSCVRQIDQAYLVSGTLPAAGTVCTD
jgi:pimeloyl-ACP methyl ester carboxylesterase